MAFKTLPDVTVSGANTATKIVATATRAHSLTLVADSGNAAVLWVGDVNVSSTGTTRGIPVAAGAAFPFSIVNEIASNDFDLSQIYIASTSSTAKAHLAYVEG